LIADLKHSVGDTAKQVEATKEDSMCGIGRFQGATKTVLSTLFLLAGSFLFADKAEADRNFGHSTTVFYTAGSGYQDIGLPGDEFVDPNVEFIAWTTGELIITRQTGTAISGYVRHMLWEIGNVPPCSDDNGFPQYSDSVHWSWTLLRPEGCYPDAASFSMAVYNGSGSLRVDYWFSGHISCKAGYSGDPCTGSGRLDAPDQQPASLAHRSSGAAAESLIAQIAPHRVRPGAATARVGRDRGSDGNRTDAGTMVIAAIFEESRQAPPAIVASRTRRW
jgi:hypothetical protein